MKNEHEDYWNDDETNKKNGMITLRRGVYQIQRDITEHDWH